MEDEAETPVFDALSAEHPVQLEAPNNVVRLFPEEDYARVARDLGLILIPLGGLDG